MSFDDPFNPEATKVNSDADNNFYNFVDEDPAAEFLARERQELGDIAGNVDENTFNNPFGGSAGNIERNSPFQNGTQSPMFNMAGNESPVSHSLSSPYQALSELNEPEKIRKWKEEFTARISKKDADEENKRVEMREQAKKELDDFYKQRVEQMERTRGHNRSHNRSYEEDLLNNGSTAEKSSNGQVHDWDKIASLCEFNPKTNRSQKDLTRYRSVLLQLKQQQTTGK